MKKISALFIGAVLLLASCTPTPNVEEEDVVQKDNESDQEKSIVPSYKFSNKNYEMPIPYRTSAARGLIADRLGNRLDIDEMEEGLRRHSKAVFDPEKYMFEAGQYVTTDMINEWLGRKMNEDELQKAKEEYREENDLDDDEDVPDSKVQEGLNPSISTEDTDDPEEVEEEQRKNPKYISHILEQNFLQKNEDDTAELSGLSIGIALKSVYRFQAEQGGPYYYEDISRKEIAEKGKKAAQKVLDRLRDIEELENVPIMIALYQEESQDSPVPGNFFAETTVGADEAKIDEWEDIEEEYVLFPSDNGEDNHFEEYQIIEDFGDEIANYFPNYTGVIGEGFYIEDNLRKMTIKIPIEFYSKGEIIAFSQYVYSLVKEMFPTGYELEVQINSSDKMESMIYQEADDESPSVHIFH